MSKLVQFTGVHFPDLNPNWAIPEKNKQTGGTGGVEDMGY